MKRGMLWTKGLSPFFKDREMNKNKIGFSRGFTSCFALSYVSLCVSIG